MTTLSPLPIAAEPAPGPDDARRAETELIRDTLAGQPRAFETLVRTHQGRVFNYLYQMTRRHHDAQDLTQQTFIKAYQSLARFDCSRPLINWLLTIARNSALNQFRDQRPWDEIPHDAAAADPSPVRSAEMREATTGLWDRARTVLTPREYEILWLRFAEELSTAETARVVGLTETHVKVLVHRARQTLLKGASRP
jgi:RNA polymerase sigma-70 factor, ECF subfamily